MSEWIKISDNKPAYGLPVLLKINGIVQHVTFMIDGADGDDEELRDLFTQYGADTYGENSFFVDYESDLQWMELPK